MQFQRPLAATPVAHARPADVHGNELERVLRLCSHSMIPRSPITLHSAQEEGRRAWVADWFLPVILPKFLQALEFARREQGRDLARLDLELAAELPLPLAHHSARAGRPLLEQLRPAKRIGWVRRFETEALPQKNGGQFAVCYAIACAFFNVGNWNAILALLCEEFAAGSGILPWDFSLETREFTSVLDLDMLRLKVGELGSGLTRFHVA